MKPRLVTVFALSIIVLLFGIGVYADAPTGTTDQDQFTLPYRGFYPGTQPPGNVAAFLMVQQNPNRGPNSPAIYGSADANDGGWFTSIRANGVFAQGRNTGVWAEGAGYGVYALNLAGGPGILGANTSGTDTKTAGVVGRGKANSGGIFVSDSGFGVLGSTNRLAGVTGMGSGSQTIGVFGAVEKGSQSIGVAGSVDSSVSQGFAGFFQGDVGVTGRLRTSGAMMATMDHPLAPAQKYLNQAAVLANEQTVVFSGNATTDAKGEAIVALPDYAQAISGDFRYQLTPVGQFAQAIVGAKVAGNHFTIRTDKPDVEVSWTVVGIRQDASAKSHPFVAEETKTGKEVDTYLDPAAFGKPATLSRDKALLGDLQQQMQAAQKAMDDGAVKMDRPAPDINIARLVGDGK
ncbi:MAG: hypothetical protein U0768_10030 [Anaerolineae bacterium]